MNKFEIRGLSAFAVLLFASLNSGVSLAATGSTPTPPLKICIGSNNCATSSASSSGAATGIKWHPGTYVDPGNIKCDSVAQTDDFSTIDQIGSDPHVQGIHIQWKWNCLEGATAGDYSAGFAKVDAYIAKLSKYGKRLILGIWPMDYGPCDGSNSANGVFNWPQLPAYVVAHGGGPNGWVSYCTPGPRQDTAQLWNPAVMDRLIALSAAYSARYDSNPSFEMFSLHDETAGLIGNTSDGFNWPASVSQWRRLTAAAVSQWTHTQVMSPLNYFQDDTTTRKEYSTAYGPGLVFGACDTLLDQTRLVPGTLVYRGLDSNGNAQSGWTDFRPVYKNWFTKIVGGQSLYAHQTPAQSWDYAYNTMHASYIVWYRTNYVSGANPEEYWSQVWPYIQSGASPSYYTACPPGWTCNTT